MQTPEHIQLLSQYSKLKEPTYDQLVHYIQVSKVGGHFSFYAMGKKPTSEMFIKLYNENKDFQEWCDRHPNATTEFINRNHLVQAANVYKYSALNAEDVCIYALKHKQHLSGILAIAYKSKLMTACRKTPKLFLNYIQMINMDEKEEKLFINKVIQIDVDVANKLEKFIKYPNNKDHLISQVVLKKLTT